MPEVTVYSAVWCGFCHQLKEWLKENKVAFKEIDVEEDLEAAKNVVKATGQMGVPVTKIGDEYVVGFDRPKLSELLSIKA